MTEASTQMRAPVARVAPDAIRLERVLDAPMETVWRYLTEAELRSQWFMGGTDAGPGGEFELVVDHDNLSEDDVPYPEDYAGAKGKRFTEKVVLVPLFVVATLVLLWLNTPANSDVWMAFIWCFVLIFAFAPLAVKRYRTVAAK